RTAGVGALIGIPAIQRWLRSLLDDAEHVVNRVGEILAACPDALLVRNTNAGVLRASRGAYERPFLLLMVFGNEGLVARMELFDADRGAEALARFDALTAPRAERRVRPNAVARFLERANTAIRTDDFDALSALHADAIRVVHHQAGIVFERAELLAWWRLFF